MAKQYDFEAKLHSEIVNCVLTGLFLLFSNVQRIVSSKDSSHGANIGSRDKNKFQKSPGHDETFLCFINFALLKIVIYFSANRSQIHHDASSVTRLPRVHGSHPLGREIVSQQHLHSQFPLQLFAQGKVVDFFCFKARSDPRNSLRKTQR